MKSAIVPAAILCGLGVFVATGMRGAMVNQSTAVAEAPAYVVPAREEHVVYASGATARITKEADGRRVLEHDRIHMRRTRFLWDATVYERLAMRNFGDRASPMRLEIEFAADFADLFEVRGTKRERRGHMHPPEVEADRVRLVYTGLDGATRTTRLSFYPAPTTLTGTNAIFKLKLAPGETQVITLAIRCGTDEPDPPTRPFLSALRDARRALRASASRAAAVSTCWRISAAATFCWRRPKLMFSRTLMCG